MATESRLYYRLLHVCFPRCRITKQPALADNGLHRFRGGTALQRGVSGLEHGSLVAQLPPSPRALQVSDFGRSATQVAPLNKAARPPVAAPGWKLIAFSEVAAYV